MDKGKLFIVLAAIGVFIMLYSYNPTSPVTTINGNWDISSQVKENKYEQYLLEETDFDYSNPSVLALAKSIKESSKTDEEAIQQTLKYVAKNIRYNGAITVNYCYNEKASTVLENKKGDCVSMSRLVTALLRAQGIPTRTMGGCLSAGIRCSPLMAIVPGLEPQTTQLIEGDFKKRGFLHEYVEIWTPSKGWRVGEATSGQIFEMSCGTYLDYGYDSNNFNRCVINDIAFWQQCSAY